MSIADNTPVIVGVGQGSERLGEPGYAALSPMDLAGRALARAIDDSRAAGSAASAIDTIAAIRQFEISTSAAVAPFGKADNPPRAIGRRVGADPARAILEVTGGQGPQRLVGELAAEIAAGHSRVAAIVGAEAISTALALAKAGEKPDWSEEVGGQLEDRGYGMSGLIERTLIEHGIASPIACYALFENARRAREGLSLEAYRQQMGALFAPFTQVAAANPHAAAPVRRSAAELAEVSERNRIVAEPYTRMMVARDQVNQAAAVVLASAGAARELGIPEDRWVHIHAVTDAKEASVLGRADLSRSPASNAAIREALAIAGVDFEELAYRDLYSCFPIAVFNVLDAFAAAPAGPEGLTLTGGLPFFGGAGNNYSTHAIAEAVARLRADREAFALVGANGGYMSKYAAGVFSAQPADWSTESRWRTLPDEPSRVEIADGFAGQAEIETYTLLPGSQGPRAVAVARTTEGRRIVAAADPSDQAAIAMIEQSEPFGRRIVVAAAPTGTLVFRCGPV